MMLGEVIRQVVAAPAPVHHELTLQDSVVYPIEAHIDRFRSALFDGAVGNASGKQLVRLDGSG
jgi:hypothetical protein